MSLISQIPLFAALSEAECDQLQAQLQERPVPANQLILSAGELGDEFFIIASGKVRIFVPDDHGREITVAMLQTGQFFGELSLLDGGRRTASARSETETMLLVLTRQDFIEFLMGHPSAAVHLLTILGQRQRETLDRLRGIQNPNVVTESRRTPMQRISERIADIGASEIFVMVNLVIFGIWMLVSIFQKLIGQTPFDDPPTFGILNFLIALESILLSMFVLNSQKRQGEQATIKAELDYQTNRLAHLEILRLHEKIDRVAAGVSNKADEKPSITNAAENERD